MRDAIFFVKATVTQLKAIVASGPRHLKAHLPSSPTKNVLLETVFKMRTEEAVQSRLNQRTPDESLRELMNLTPDQLKVLASSDASNLAELMRSALQADENLQPRDIPASPDNMVIIALSWQLDAHKSARPFPDSNTPPPPRTLQTRDRTDAPAIVTPPRAPAHAPEVPSQPKRLNVPQPPTSSNLAAIIPQSGDLPASLQDILTGLRAARGIGAPAQPRHHDSDDEDLSPTGKRQRVQLVPKGFTFGSVANIEQLLKHYRGKAISSPALACKELLGPYILVQFLQAGNNLPIFLQDFKHLRKTANGTPSQSELEAHTSGRIIYLEMLMHQSPREALENRPSL